MSTYKRTQVAIVGAGPCGVTVANYLGLRGIDTILIDRNADILDYPRAVGVDDEALRSWQGIQLADILHKDMIENVPVRYYNSKRQLFAQVSPSAQPFGWPRRNVFLQPLTERTLRDGLSRFACVETLYNAEMEHLSQDEHAAHLRVRDAEGQSIEIDCDFVVGADGGRSTVRKLLGIELIGTTSATRWLVVDVVNDSLYKPYSAIYCHPRRPSMSIDLPYGYRRFEFMLLPTDTDEEMLKEHRVAELMRPHYSKETRFPEIKRARIYQHHSRIAPKFRQGRCFLAGDAAHLQPPFFGQGMNSGIRDATNLSWKLAEVLKGHAHPKILDTYESERRDHALAMVKFATWIGSFYQPRNRPVEALRDFFFKCVQSIPSIRDYVLQLKFKPMPYYAQGIVIPASNGAPDRETGRMFMQPVVTTGSGERVKLDDVIGQAFAVIGFNFNPETCLDSDNRSFLKEIGARTVFVKRALAAPEAQEQPSDDTVVVEDITGAFRDRSMSNPRAELIILRPDRYVVATGSRSSINTLIPQLRSMLQ